MRSFYAWYWQALFAQRGLAALLSPCFGILTGPLMQISSSTPGVKPVSADELEALALGAWILGTGGGGDPYQKLLNMRQIYQAGQRVDLLDPMFLDDSDLVAVVSAMGAPLVGQERLADPAFAMKPVRMMEEYLGKRFRAVMALEIGGGNGLQPFMVAAMMGLPVVDADCMGRAYPEAQMTSFAVHGLNMYPMGVADIRDNEVIVTRAASAKWVERLSRKVVVEMGSTAATCKAPRSGREVKESGILYTTTKAVRLGLAVFEARRLHQDVIATVLRETGGQHMFCGKVIDVERRTTEGFLRGQATLEGLGADRGAQFMLNFQNEFSVGMRDGAPVVMTPDLICVLDSVSGDGIGTDVLRFGQRVSVLALPAPQVFTTPRGLELVGPRAFGFDLDYRTVFA